LKEAGFRFDNTRETAIKSPNILSTAEYKAQQNQPMSKSLSQLGFSSLPVLPPSVVPPFISESKTIFTSAEANAFGKRPQVANL
jgi:hypothetical protein